MPIASLFPFVLPHKKRDLQQLTGDVRGFWVYSFNVGNSNVMYVFSFGSVAAGSLQSVAFNALSSATSLPSWTQTGSGRSEGWLLWSQLKHELNTHFPGSSKLLLKSRGYVNFQENPNGPWVNEIGQMSSNLLSLRDQGTSNPTVDFEPTVNASIGQRWDRFSSQMFSGVAPHQWPSQSFGAIPPQPDRYLFKLDSSGFDLYLVIEFSGEEVNRLSWLCSVNPVHNFGGDDSLNTPGAHATPGIHELEFSHVASVPAGTYHYWERTNMSPGDWIAIS